MRGQKFASFLQTESGLQWRKNYLISALVSREQAEGRDRLELAMRRLDQFDHVFLMESLADDIAAMSREGWTHLDLPWRNAGEHGNAAWSASREAMREHPGLLARLVAENQGDLELYTYAQALVKRRREGAAAQMRESGGARQMPSGRSFDFIVTCAYEAHLMGDEARCLQLLERAENHRKARGIDIGSCRTLTEFALLRFQEPKLVRQAYGRRVKANQALKRTATAAESRAANVSPARSRNRRGAKGSSGCDRSH